MKNAEKQKPAVGFVALGCPKNVVDSERMLAEIAQAGFPITAEPNEADIVVINTCGFIAPAVEESLEAIKKAVNRKRNGAVKKVIVAGCLPQRLGRELFEQAEGIDAIVGLGQRDNIAEIIEQVTCSEKAEAYLEQSAQAVNDDRTRLLITPSHWAYLRISEGCDHKCSFCTIPFIRGRFRSKPLENVIAEAEELVQAGVVELNVIAQDTTSYGRDLGIKNGLAELLRGLEKIAELKWVRLMYLYPLGINDYLIETIATSEKTVHYLDIPIQHINDKILRDMRRPDTKEGICGLIERLRSVFGDIVLRTTVMAGFPGETEEQFEELLEFIKWAQFDAMGCFKYYAEAGTAAADMQGQIPERIKQQRYDAVMEVQQETAFAKTKSRIGSELVCIVDSAGKKKSAQGRFYGQAPDIDGVCIIENCFARLGDFIEAKVINARGYDLIVRQTRTQGSSRQV